MLDEESFTRIADSSEKGQVLSHFQRSIGDAGFSAFSYVDLGPSGSSEDEIYYETTVRNDFISSYTGEGFLEHDPVVLRSSVAHNPFSWYDCSAFRGAKTYKRGHKNYARRILELAYDYEFNDGVIVPVHNVGPDGLNRSALISLYHPKQQKIHKEGLELEPSLRLLSMYLHEKMISLRQGRESVGDIEEGYSLTDRQREILKWAARGKSSDEVGMILGLTKPTVEFHLHESFKRLRVFNKTHAVAIAISHGLISL